MNLIAEVARLKELEAARNLDCDRTIFAYVEALQDAAPKLLAVLSGFQAGDVDEIDYAIQELTRIFGPDNVAETIEVLHRYRDMAQAMEVTR